MKKVLYICDLCKEEKPKDMVMKFYYSGWDAETKGSAYKVLPNDNDINSCDKHICQDCIHAIAKYLNQKPPIINKAP